MSLFHSLALGATPDAVGPGDSTGDWEPFFSPGISGTENPSAPVAGPWTLSINPLSFLASSVSVQLDWDRLYPWSVGGELAFTRVQQSSYRVRYVSLVGRLTRWFSARRGEGSWYLAASLGPFVSSYFIADALSQVGSNQSETSQGAGILAKGLGGYRWSLGGYTLAAGGGLAGDVFWGTSHIVRADGSQATTKNQGLIQITAELYVGKCF